MASIEGRVGVGDGGDADAAARTSTDVPMDLQTHGPTLATALMARATVLQQGNQHTTGSLEPSFLPAAQASVERVVRPEGTTCYGLAEQLQLLEAAFHLCSHLWNRPRRLQHQLSFSGLLPADVQLLNW